MSKLILSTFTRSLFFLGAFVLVAVPQVLAAAPTGTNAVMQNSTATSVDIVITGTDFDTFVSSTTNTADATDLGNIFYNGQNPTTAVINNSTTLTATFPIVTGTGKSGLTLDIAASTVQDSLLAPNALINIADGTIVDNADPWGTTVVGTATVYTGDLIQEITVTYTEVMDPLFLPAIAFTGYTGLFTSNTDGAWSGGNTIWTETFTHDGTAEETLGVSVGSNSAQDLPGNGEGSGVLDLFDIDTKNPTGTVSVGTATLFEGDLMQEVTVNYDEPMAVVPTPIITFSATAGTLISNGDGTWATPTQWTESFTISDADEEVTGVITDSTAATDLAGNSEGLDVPDMFDVDTLAPVISAMSFTPSTGTAKIGDAVTLNITADAAGYSAGAITVNSVATGALSDNAGGNYSAIYTVVSLDADQLAGLVPASAVLMDAAGNTSAPFSTVTANTLAIDANAPTVTSITSVTPDDSYNAPDAIDVTVTFSEAVTLVTGPLNVTLDTGDVVAIAAFGPSMTASGTYTVGAGDTSADLDSTAISLGGGTLRDGALNDAIVVLPATTIAVGSAIVIDTTNPTPTVTTSPATIYDGALTSTVTVTYDEAMDPATKPVIGMSGANWGAQSDAGLPAAWSVGNTVYTATFTHNGTAETNAGAVATILAASGATDVAGNTENGDVSPAFLIDTVNPSPTVTTSPAAIFEGALMSTIMVTYDEAMNPGTSPVITMGGSNWGAQSNMGWTVGNTVFTATFTHNGTQEVILTEQAVISPASGATDVAGNTENGDGSPTFLVDTVKPTVVSVTPSDTTLNDSNVGTGTFTVTVVYSEPMNTGVPPTIVFSLPGEAGLSSPPSHSWSVGDTVYTATYDLADVPEDNPLIDIDVTGGQDVVGNVQTAYNEPNAFSINTTNVTVVSAETDDSDNDGQIDRVIVAFSGNITDEGSYGVGADTTPGLQIAGYDVVAFSNNGTALLTYVLTESGAPDTGATPLLIFTVANYHDDAFNDLDPAGAPAWADDMAEPVVLSAVTGDGDNDGQIDRISVTYSEAVSDANYDAFSAAGYTMPGTGSGNNTNVLVYNLNESGTPDTAATPALTWTVANAQDLATAPNLLNALVPLNAVDAAPPVPVSGMYKDIDANGTIDQADVTWSENIVEVSLNGADHIFGVGSAFGVIGISTSTEVANLQQLGIAPANSNFTGSVVPLTYQYSNNANRIQDSLGNNSLTSTPFNLVDGAAPFLLSFTSMITPPGVAVTPPGYYNAGDFINITANYTEALNTGAMTVIMNSGGNESVFTVSGSTLYATHIVGPGENTIAPPSPLGDLNISSIVSQNVTDFFPNALTSTTLPALNIQDQAGNIVIDTTRPLGTVTVQTNVIYEGDDIQEIQVAYNELMNTAIFPQFNFTGMTGTWTEVSCSYGNNTGVGYWLADNRTYRTCYQVTDADEDTGTDGASVNSMAAEDLAGNTEGAGTTDSFTLDTYIALTDGNVSITGATGTGGAYKIGNTITVTWDSSSPAGDNNYDDLVGSTAEDVFTIVADLTQFGGNPFVNMTDTTACGGTAGDGIYEACYTIDGTEGIDDTNNNVILDLTDDEGNTRNLTDTANATVDTIAPAVSTVYVSGASGTGGAFRFVDTAVLHWDGNTDGETDTIVTATFDGTTFESTSSGLTGGVFAAANHWSASLNAAMDAQDDYSNNKINVTVEDNAGNITGPIDSPDYIVDTIVPVVTQANVFVNGASGTGGAFRFGDMANGIWTYDVSGDNETDTLASVLFDTSEFQATPGSYLASSGSTSYTTGTFTPDLQDDTESLTNSDVTVTVTDDAGNITAVIDNNDYIVDTIVPVVSGSCLTANGATGTGGAFKIGDTVYGRWNDTAGCDGGAATNRDILSVDFDLSLFNSTASVAAGTEAPADDWATGTTALDTLETTGNTISATAMDDAGNVTGPSSSSTSYIIDTVAPVATIVTPANNSNSGATVNVQVTTNDNSNCSSQLDAGAITSLNGSGTMTHSRALANLTSGSHTITVTSCTDDVGNPMAAPVASTWTVSFGGGCLPGSCPPSGGGGGGGGGGGVTPTNTNTNSTNSNTNAANTNTNAATTNSNTNSTSGSNSNVNSTTPVTGSGSFFLDTPGHWAHDVVESLHIDCQIDGYADDAGNLLHLFKPNNQITRAELMVMVIKCKEGNLPSVSVAPFEDVSPDHWAAQYIARAKELGIVEGYETRTGWVFRPDQLATRSEALKMILLTFVPYDTVSAAAPTTLCGDVAQSNWSAKYWNYGVGNGVITGYKDANGNPLGICKPGANISRAESSAMIMRTKGTASN